MTFGFLVVWGVAMHLLDDDPTRAQTLFRGAVALAGLVGLAWLRPRRPNRRRP